jgi:hypothetical protein
MGSGSQQPGGHKAGRLGRVVLESCKLPPPCREGSSARCSDPYGKTNTGGPFHRDLVFAEEMAVFGTVGTAHPHVVEPLFIPIFLPIVLPRTRQLQ